MEDKIKITMPEVANSCSQIRNINSNLDEVLNNITNNMNSLSAYWEANSSSTIVAKFKNFANRFVKESETIEEYCKFLDLTVQTYGSLENTITSNAETFE